MPALRLCLLQTLAFAPARKKQDGLDSELIGSGSVDRIEGITIQGGHYHAKELEIPVLIVQYRSTYKASTFWDFAIFL